MKLCKAAVGLALTIVLMGALAGAANAEGPTFSLLPGEKAETVKVERHATTAVTFETALGTKITCSLGHLDTTWFLFIIQITNHEKNDKCKSGTNSCKTGTEESGVITYTDEGRPVYLSLSPLKVGFLFTIPETTIACGTTEKPEKEKLKLKGSFLMAYNGAFSTDLTSFKTSVKGSKGKPEFTKFFNKEGKEETAKLELNAGLGFESADLNIEGELEDTAASMVIVTG